MGKSALSKVASLYSHTKAVDDASGVVEALVAVTGNVDDGNDIIVPGAIGTKRKPKIVWSHDMDAPVAKVTAMRELRPYDPALPDDIKAKGYGALWMSMQFNLAQDSNGNPLDPESAKAFAKVQFFGDEMGWSIGYSIPSGGSAYDKSGRRLLKSIEIWEASPVTHGMNVEARSLAVKASAPLKGTIEELQHEISEALRAWGDANYPTAARRWSYIEGTYPDSVVASFYVADTEDGEGRTETFRFGYAVDENGVVALGSAEQVEIEATIVPADDSDDSVDGEMAVKDDDEEDDMDTKVGRVFAQRNMEKLRSMRSTLDAMIAEMADDEEPDKTEKDDDKASKPEAPEEVTLGTAALLDPKTLMQMQHALEGFRI